MVCVVYMHKRFMTRRAKEKHWRVPINLHGDQAGAERSFSEADKPR
jgi:hypothetical protein